MFRSLLLGTLLCLTAVPAYAQDSKPVTVTIKKRALVVGDVLTFAVTRKKKMGMTLTSNDDPTRSDKMDRVIDAVAGKTIEIIEVKDGKVTKIKVTFGKIAKVVHDKQRTDSGEEDKDPLSGRSFTVSHADKKLIIKTAKGEVDASDEYSVTKAIKWFFEEQGRGFAGALPSTPIKLNAEFAPPLSALRRLLEIKKEDKNSQITKPKMVFKGLVKLGDVHCAKFALSADAKSEKFGPMKALIMSMKAKGMVFVEVETGRVLSIQSSSKVVMGSAPNKLFKATGAGSTAQTHTMKYSVASSNMNPTPKK
ncbi:MAG: hypothetical protein P1V97_01560 [Planctomycetota bacterium]|nr:hypothetical protein [Planctomycetota bacterium]